MGVSDWLTENKIIHEQQTNSWINKQIHNQTNSWMINIQLKKIRLRE